MAQSLEMLQGIKINVCDLRNIKGDRDEFISIYHVWKKTWGTHSNELPINKTVMYHKEKVLPLLLIMW